jgi:hypothetical protein
MANTENTPPNDGQSEGDSADSEFMEVEIDRNQRGGSYPEPDEEWVTWEIEAGDKVIFGKAKLEGDNVVRPMPESHRKFLPWHYQSQPRPDQLPEPPQDKPPA